MNNNNETSKESHSEALNIADVSGSYIKLTQIKYLKFGDLFRFKNRKTINTFLKDDRVEIYFSNKKGNFTTDYYNEIVELLPKIDLHKKAEHNFSILINSYGISQLRDYLSENILFMESVRMDKNDKHYYQMLVKLKKLSFQYICGSL